MQPADQFREIGRIVHKEQCDVTIPGGQLEIMSAEIKMKQAAVDIIENQFRKKVHQGMGGESILQGVDQHTGQIDTGACQQHGGDDCNLLVEKDQNGKKQNAHGYTEITGENIQIDLGKEDDENTEREGLLSFGGLYHKLDSLSIWHENNNSGKNPVFQANSFKIGKRFQ